MKSVRSKNTQTSLQQMSRKCCSNHLQIKCQINYSYVIKHPLVYWGVAGLTVDDVTTLEKVHWHDSFVLM